MSMWGLYVGLPYGHKKIEFLDKSSININILPVFLTREVINYVCVGGRGVIEEQCLNSRNSQAIITQSSPNSHATATPVTPSPKKPEPDTPPQPQKRRKFLDDSGPPPSLLPTEALPKVGGG